jgi:hypothetical protein
MNKKPLSNDDKTFKGISSYLFIKTVHFLRKSTTGFAKSITGLTKSAYLFIKTIYFLTKSTSGFAKSVYFFAKSITGLIKTTHGR